jgi:hypothetical protein
LHEWHDWLSNHSDPRVRVFYRFAGVCERNAQGSEYRRLGVRTYDVFRRSLDTRPGFRVWMEQSEVAAGAEQLLVLLAYMEVARASTEKIGRTPTHPGFWTLAEEWHPNAMRLPREETFQHRQFPR